ncbi:MAG: tRNA pseudouridine(13) synthase TruD [Methanomassiliicoccus sp.]|nr:tRNA pseudouridine(13) synthase TruD [Methanomassiliicoccus sp.]
MLECTSREAVIGLEVFYSDTPGIGGRLKRSPEDFRVEEIPSYPERVEGGPYTVVKVTAQNWEMNRLVRELSRTLGISRDAVGFAGTKDKRAITSQLMTFRAPADRVMNLRLHQVTVEDAYPAKKPLTIGDLVGNRFHVLVSGTSLRGEELTSSLDRTAGTLRDLGGFPNFFGVQRFGAVRPVTHEVGKWIVKGDFERAVMTYAGNPVPQENEETQAARRTLDEERDFQRALDYFPRTLTFERTIIGFLARNPGDHAGAIQVLPPNLQMMFVHAYQSFLFNRMVSERIRRGLPLDRPLVGDIVLPVDRLGLPDHDHGVPVTAQNLDLVERQVRNGRACVSAVLFGSESVLCEGEMGEIERTIIDEEKLERQDFMVPQLHQCSSKGNRREVLGRITDLEYAVADEDVRFSFSLNKGCYATSLLREFMKKGELMDY